MIKTLVYRLLRHRHFWREVGFDELSELYIGMMFRSMALHIGGLFIPFFLIDLDYSASDIFLVYAWYATFRFAVFDLIAAHTVARFGPKHSMLVGHLILIFSTALFLTLPQHAWPLWLLGGIWGGAQSFFFIAFNVDFSKVQHRKHGGKEFGYVTIMEKSGAVLGPLIGGFIATVFGPKYIFVATMILLIGGLLPLFRTAEPTRTKQHLDFRHFKLDGQFRDFVAFVGVGVENVMSLFVWPIFLGLFILVGSSAYAKFGFLTSISFIASILAARAIGQVIDHRKGRKLLRYSALANSAIHLCRPFVTTFPVAFGLNILNDIVTPGYRMPFFKGLFDAADDNKGHRIVYLSSIEIFGSLIKAVTVWLLVILSFNFNARTVVTVGFLIAAVMSILIMAERFKALDPPKYYNEGNE